MRTLTALGALVLCLAGVSLTAVEPAEAYVATGHVIVHRGPYGHGCRTVAATVWRSGHVIHVRRRVCF